MKITIYELLGMVKDGKVPKKIKYDGKIYKYNAVSDDYMQPNSSPFTGLLDDICVFSQLYDEIEIIDDTLEEEKKIPEKLEIYKSDDRTITGLRESINIMFDDTASKINSIIDYLKSKGE